MGLTMRTLNTGQRVVWRRLPDVAPHERHRYTPARVVGWMGTSTRIELDRQLEDDDPLVPYMLDPTTLVVGSDSLITAEQSNAKALNGDYVLPESVRKAFTSDMG